MTAPLLEDKKCSILFAEYATGHVFKTDLTLFKIGDNESDAFKIFDNFDEAKIFVQGFIKVNPKFECSIFDYSGGHLMTIDVNGERLRRPSTN